ncbi:uncharacterized protein ColSpa_08146 [Colletotrichum spaethianum]|uniref:Phytanoyl-CoA dioxygenase n=1 Tax=Colletotrichum spaethianum TaxID=700344 RepID=A0AA37P988_9PEZI|nr:uncharacterized protein ColSpa_08146 [Colletotrichum spaethianum]GKT47965.1 uncharacterized protein ColSpa_08146 [Colletotrichum spaethianum]
MTGRSHDVIVKQTGAGTRLGRSATASPSAPNIAALIAHVEAYGYVVIPNAFTAAEADEAHDEVLRLASSPTTAGPAGASGGRNAFEGHRTRRVYALLNKSPAFYKFPLHPALLALNDHFLDPGFLLNAFHSVYIQPGEAPQPLHHDDGQGVMIALNRFTATNSATVVIPASHTWGPDTDLAQARRENTTPVVMSKGSAVFFLGTLWHGGRENTSAHERRALTVQYCQPWMRPPENQVLAVEWEKLSGMPRRLVDLLGYEVGAPFVGYAHGLHPWKVVQRRLREREGGGNQKL